MSNAYTNQILFGHSKAQVNKKYIEDLFPYMLTENRLNELISEPQQRQVESDVIASLSSSVPSVLSVLSVPSAPEAPKVISESVPMNKYVEHCGSARLPQNSIFWSIYEIEYPEEAFLGTRANVEIEHRIKVVDFLKKTPKRLKETNSKLTLEQTQALFGSMLISKEDKLDFCIAYAAYYNKPILVLYKNTYCVFSPTIEIDLSEGDAIILYASRKGTTKSMSYSSEKNPTQCMINEIIETKVLGPLKAMSNYKNPELDSIAERLQIAIKYTEQGKEKRRKKEDIYNDIRVAIHQDQTV